MLTYLLQSSTCLIAFYGIYHFVLTETPLFRYNRLYLLGAIVASLIIPLISPYLIIPQQIVPVIHWSYMKDDVNVFVTQSLTEKADILVWIQIIISWLYFTGVFIVLTKMIYGLYKIYKMYLTGKKEIKSTYTLITTESVHLPFSFFNKIFISRYIPLQDHIHTILEHEEIHIRQCHSLDVLMAEMVHAFFWFNPVMIFYKRALRQEHEYLADDLICRKNPVSSYAELLLSKSQSGLEMALTNQFFHSQIKKRITMMYTKNSDNKAVWKYAVAIPVVIGLVFIFSSYTLKKVIQVQLPLFSDSIAPPPPSETILPEGVKSIHIQNEKAKVVLKNGKSEKYDLTKSEEKRSFEAKYGDSVAPAPPPPPPPAPKTAKAPMSPPLPPAPPTPPVAPDVPRSAISPPDAPPSPPPALHKNMKAYTEVDEMPRFPGCEHLVDINDRNKCAGNRLLEYLYSSIKYPDEARKNVIEGSVIAEFMVDKNGYIYNLKIIKGIGYGCDEEVERVVSAMNKLSERWIPGKKDGKNINVIYTIPVKFQLSSGITK